MYLGSDAESKSNLHLKLNLYQDQAYHALSIPLVSIHEYNHPTSLTYSIPRSRISRATFIKKRRSIYPRRFCIELAVVIVRHPLFLKVPRMTLCFQKYRCPDIAWLSDLLTAENALNVINRYCSHGCLRADRKAHDIWCKAKAKGLTAWSEGDRPKVNRGQEVD